MRHVPLFLLCAAVLVSCSGTPVSEPHPGGEIYGNVELRFVNGSPTHYGGVVVTLTDITGLSDTTNNGGAYSIENIPGGRFAIRFERPGFGHYVLHDVEILANGRHGVPKVELAEIPRASIEEFAATRTATGIAVSGSVSEDGLAERGQMVVVYFGNAPGVSNHPRDHVLRRFVEVERGSRAFSDEIGIEYLRSIGIASGTTLHAVAYTIDYSTYTRYTIPGYSNEYATSLNGPSSRATVVVP